MSTIIGEICASSFNASVQSTFLGSAYYLQMESFLIQVAFANYFAKAGNVVYVCASPAGMRIPSAPI